MSHIVYCWEIGTDLGHIAPWASIAKELVAQGHTVSCILKDLTHAARILEPLGIRWYQAPLSLKAPPAGYPLNHADILHGLGYDEPDRLTGLLQGWISLLQLLQPDRVIVDAAPTAILAARALALSVLNLDTGFFAPPPNDPLPPLRDWEAPLPEELRRREARTLRVINASLVRLHREPLPDFKSLFNIETRYCTWPQLNPFGPHSPEKHLGPILADAAGQEPEWPAGSGEKVFAYLKPEHPLSIPAIEAAAQQGYRVLVYMPHRDPEIAARLQANGPIKISAKPFNLTGMTDLAFVIGHGGSGVVSRFIAQGQRLLILPMQLEQLRVARAASQAGLAVEIIQDPNAPDWQQIMARLRERSIWRGGGMPLSANEWVQIVMNQTG